MELSFWQGFLGSALGVTIVSFFLKIAERFINEWRSNVSQNRTEKQLLSKKILKICSEGNDHHHSIMPKDNQHIKYVAYQAKFFDKQIYEDLLEYLRTWKESARPESKEEKTPQRLERKGNAYIECNRLNSIMLQHAEVLKK